jgi:hypothetical protein
MFVLSIKERGHSWAGREPLVMNFATREKAEQEIADYVSECWDDEMDIDKPEDTEEMVDAYFDHVLEEYEILEVNPQ